jgi:hypothetical protein
VVAAVIEQDTNQAMKNAARAFTELHPEYITCPENLEPMMDYLVEHPDLDKTAVASYEEAFRATRDKLRLKNLPPLEPTTTDADFERLSADEYKTRVVIPEFQKLNQSGEPSPMDDAFWGAHTLIARSAYNPRLLFEWLTAQQLKPSLANLHTAYEQIASGWGNARLVLFRTRD